MQAQVKHTRTQRPSARAVLTFKAVSGVSVICHTVPSPSAVSLLAVDYLSCYKHFCHLGYPTLRALVKKQSPQNIIRVMFYSSRLPAGPYRARGCNSLSVPRNEKIPAQPLPGQRFAYDYHSLRYGEGDNSHERVIEGHQGTVQRQVVDVRIFSLPKRSRAAGKIGSAHSVCAEKRRFIRSVGNLSERSSKRARQISFACQRKVDEGRIVIQI